MSIEISAGSSVHTTAGPHAFVTQKNGGQIDEKPQAEAATTVGHADVIDAVRKANEFVRPLSDSIEFTLDQDSGRLIVKMVDLETQQVIRQFPSEEMLALIKAMDKLQGLLVEQKA